MLTSTAFRLSVYLTLTFACAATGYAESSFLVEAPIIAGAVIVSLWVLYRLESRVELLTIPAANRLGLVVGIANLGWAVVRILREVNNPEMPHTDWPMLGLGLTGPFVMTLMPAKLARREKHAGDYWWLYGLGLATAALAGAMADDLIAFVLIGLYALCAIWSLTLFALLRADRSIRPIPGQETETCVISVMGSERARLGAALAPGLATIAAIVTVPLYLLTPRSGYEKLEFGKPRVEIGYAADQMVDLTQTGNLRANDQMAFGVTAETAAGPKLDLPLEQRWRGQIKTRYQSGRWQEGPDYKLPAVAPAPRTGLPNAAPRLWPDQTTLTFSLPRGTRGRFLADPVTWVGNAPAPVAWITSTGYRTWLWGGNGLFLGEGRGRNSAEPIRYVQAWRMEDPPDVGPPLQLIDQDIDGALRPLLVNPVQRVKEYADAIVEQMVLDGTLPPDHRDRVSMLPRPEFHDLIARTLATHLSTTPTLTYTTELRRDKKDIDPIEDFLFHTRAGHCERFATALVLMLRSQGIPAVLVLGFKGCEPTEEAGQYIVRQEHAHAWVEALIEDFQPRPWWEVWRTTRWRSLDPTPSGVATTTARDDWLGRASSWVRRIHTAYLVEYTPEQRARALGTFVAALTRLDILGGLGAALAMVFVARAFIRRGAIMRAATPAGRWFDRLVAVLAPYGFQMQPGETAREFAQRATEALRQHAATAQAAEVPLDWAEAYYESRFGGQMLPPERFTALDAGLDELRSALAARGLSTGDIR